MKKGVVISLTLSHKNGKTVLRDGDKVSEDDVNNFDKLVKSGHIKLSATDKKAEKAKKEESEKAEKAKKPE
jgi:hypothetical protein